MYDVKFYEKLNGSSPVEEYLDSLHVSCRAKVVAVIQKLIVEGYKLRVPYVKSFTDKKYAGLKELRVKCDDTIERVIFFKEHNGAYYLLHGFTKKTQKTAKSDKEIARKRMNEVKKKR